jgi:hypothetical protein
MRGVTVLCLVVSLCVIAGSIHAGTAKTATRIVLVSKCGALGVQRPREIVFACADAGLRVSRLRWSTWGGRVAVGRGVQMANDCLPSCAGGHFVTTPLTLRLYQRRVCPGRSRLYYLRATFVAPNGHRTAGALGCPD